MKLKLLKPTIPASLLIASVPAFTIEAPRLEELTVTAQKRTESLTQVPIAIDVIDNAFLESSSINGLGDLEHAIPSVNFGRGGRKTRGEIAIRGVGDFSRNIGVDPRVVVYIDDVPLGRSSAFDSSLSGIKQIEVLKGPQGTLFGTNSVAGAINIITHTPSEEFQHSVRVEAGNLGRKSVGATLDIPVSENLLTSFQYNHTESDGFIDNITLNETLQGDDLDSARIKIQYTPTQRLTFTLGIDWLQDEALRTNAVALADDGMFNGFSAAPDPRQVAHNTPEFEEREIWGSSLKTAYQFDSGFELVSISAFRSSEFSELSEEDYSPIPAASSTFDEDFEQWTQEFRLISDVSDNFDYVIGTFLSQQEVNTERSATLGTNSVFTPGTLDSTSASIFGHGNFRITSTVELTVGARWQYEEKDLDYTIVDQIGLFINDTLDDRLYFSAFLPKIGININLDEDELLYASISRGTKSGGWNADFVTTLENIDFNQEFATNYEIGFKAEYFDNRLRVNTAAFVTKFSDFQVFQFVTTPPTTPGGESATLIRITNAGEVTSQGIELETRLFVTDNIDFTFSTSLTDAEFDVFENGGSNGESFAGNTLPYSPEVKSFIGANIRYPLSDTTELSAHLNYSYSDGFNSTPDNNPVFEVDSFHTVNGSMELNIGESWNVVLWGKNLTDELYLRNTDRSFLGILRGFYEPPRSYGLAIKYTQ